jgi:uncharacterized protein (UPF0248 family)
VSTIRELLNRLRWDDTAQQRGAVIEVRTREHGGERVTVIAFESLVEILPQGVTVAGGTFLPYHRFVRVLRGAEVLWPATRGEA